MANNYVMPENYLEPMDYLQPCVHILFDDELYHIFRYLSLIDLINCGKVCRRFQNISKVMVGKILKQYEHESFDLWLRDNQIFDPFLPAIDILRNCGHILQKIQLDFDHTNNILFNAIGNYCPNLEEITIELGSAEQVRDCLMQRLFAKCNEIKKLFLKGNFYSSNLEEDDFNSIFLKLPKLEVIQISCPHIFGCNSFENVPKTLKEFKSIDNCANLEKWWGRLVRNCRKLEVLTLTTTLTGADLEEIAEFCPDLTELSADLGDNINQFDFSILPKLTKLTLCAEILDLNNLENCSSLLHLNFRTPTFSSSQGVSGNFSSVSHLRSLVMNTYPQASHETLQSICLCKDLESLTLNIGTNELDHLIQCIEQLSKLSMVDCRYLQLLEPHLKLLFEAGKKRKNRIKLIVTYGDDTTDTLYNLEEANFDVELFELWPEGSLYSEEDYGIGYDFVEFDDDYDSDENEYIVGFDYDLDDFNDVEYLKRL